MAVNNADASGKILALIDEGIESDGLKIHGSPQVIDTIPRRELSLVREEIRRLQQAGFGRGKRTIRTGAALAVGLGEERAHEVIDEAERRGVLDPEEVVQLRAGVNLLPRIPITSPLEGMRVFLSEVFGRAARP